MKDLVMSCLESRVEDNRNLYARFLLAPFSKGDALTVGTALRRALLSSVNSIGITALYIQGITHEFSTIVGVRESVLELSLNFQQIVLSQKKKSFKPKTFWGEAQVGYLHVQGPKTIYANDLQLPLGVSLVDPTQYIATLSTEGLLVVKFLIESSHTDEIARSETQTYKKTTFIPETESLSSFSNNGDERQNIKYKHLQHKVQNSSLSRGLLLKTNNSLDELHSQNILKAKRLNVSHFSGNSYKQKLQTFVNKKLNQELGKRSKKDKVTATLDRKENGVSDLTRLIFSSAEQSRKLSFASTLARPLLMFSSSSTDRKKALFLNLPQSSSIFRRNKVTKEQNKIEESRAETKKVERPLSFSSLQEVETSFQTKSRKDIQQSSVPLDESELNSIVSPEVKETKQPIFLKSLLLSRNPLKKSKLTKNSFFRSDVCLRNVIPLTLPFAPVNKVNFVVESDDLSNQVRERLIIEVWTNGSVDPRQAIHEAALSLIDLLSSFRSVFSCNQLM